MNTDAYHANMDKLLRNFCNEAIKSKFWIYHADTKNWYTPEEFYEKNSKKNIYNQNGWLEDYKIMNPLLGLIAADRMIQKITEKKSGFQKKLIDYLQNK